MNSFDDEEEEMNSQLRAMGFSFNYHTKNGKPHLTVSNNSNYISEENKEKINTLVKAYYIRSAPVPFEEGVLQYQLSNVKNA